MIRFRFEPIHYDVTSFVIGAVALVSVHVVLCAIMGVAYIIR